LRAFMLPAFAPLIIGALYIEASLLVSLFLAGAILIGTERPTPAALLFEANLIGLPSLNLYVVLLNIEFVLLFPALTHLFFFIFYFFNVCR